MLYSKISALATSADAVVGRRIREQRLLVGLSLYQLAAAIGVTTQQLHKYETGLNRLSVGRLYSISQALDIPIPRFLDNLLTVEQMEPTYGRHRLCLEVVRSFGAIQSSKVQEAFAAMVRAVADSEKDP